MGRFPEHYGNVGEKDYSQHVQTLLAKAPTISEKARVLEKTVGNTLVVRGSFACGGAGSAILDTPEKLLEFAEQL